MSTAARRIGSKFETDVVAWLRSNGLDAERLHLAGKNDEGDIAVIDHDAADPLRYVIEAKAERQISLGTYIGEVLTERHNYAVARGLMPDDIMPVVVVKRRGKSIGDSYVVTTLTEFFAR